MPRSSYGIYLRNVTASPVQFGAENYLGVVSSFVSMAKMEHRPGAFLRFVREDDNNLVYGVQNNVLSSQATGTNVEFTTTHAPVLKQSKHSGDLFNADEPSNIRVTVDGEVVEVASVEGGIGKFRLMSAPPAGSEVKTSYIFRNLIEPGYYFLQVTNPLKEELEQGRFKETPQILIGSFGAVERQKVPLRSNDFKILLTPGYLKDNEIEVQIDGVPLEQGFTVYPEADSIRFSHRPAGTNFQVVHKDTQTPLESYTDWKFNSYREQTLVVSATGFEQYFSLIDPEPVEVNLYLNGKKLVPRGAGSDYDYEFTSPTMIKLAKRPPKYANIVAKYTYVDQRTGTSQTVNDIFDYLTKYSIASDGDLVPDFFEVYHGSALLDPSTYTVDYANKLLTFIELPLSSQDYKVSYRYERGTTGPFPIEKDSYRTDLLPGVILYFSRDFSVGDKAVVLVGKHRKSCMDEYGGKLDMTAELTVVTPNSIHTEEIADELMMFVNTKLKPLFDAQGMFVSPPEHGGESDEDEDEASQKTHPSSSISLRIMTDWFYRKARPYRLMSIQTNAQAVTDITEQGLYLPYFVGSKPSFAIGPDQVR